MIIFTTVATLCWTEFITNVAISEIYTSPEEEGLPDQVLEVGVKVSQD